MQFYFLLYKVGGNCVIASGCLSVSVCQFICKQVTKKKFTPIYMRTCGHNKIMWQGSMTKKRLLFFPSGLPASKYFRKLWTNCHESLWPDRISPRKELIKFSRAGRVPAEVAKPSQAKASQSPFSCQFVLHNISQNVMDRLSWNLVCRKKLLNLKAIPRTYIYRSGSDRRLQHTHTHGQSHKHTLVLRSAYLHAAAEGEKWKTILNTAAVPVYTVQPCQQYPGKNSTANTSLFTLQSLDISTPRVGSN